MENEVKKWYDLWWPRKEVFDSGYNEKFWNDNLWRSRKKIIFESSKIVAPQRSLTNTFGYNEISWYESADVYFITPKDNFYSLKYILALLNSKLYFLWLYHQAKGK